MAKLFLLKVANNHYSLNLKSSYLGFDMQIKNSGNVCASHWLNHFEFYAIDESDFVMSR